MQQHAAINYVTGATSDELPTFIDAVTCGGCIYLRSKFSIQFSMKDNCIIAITSFKENIVN